MPIAVRRRRYSLLCLSLLFLLRVDSEGFPPGIDLTSRKPLQKTAPKIELPPGDYSQVIGYNEDGEPILWDPGLKVVALGRGRYRFEWSAQPGERYSFLYERPDAIDIVVSASVVPGDSGRLRYTYKVSSLETSGVKALAFVVQTFGPAAEPFTSRRIHAGKMATFIEQFAEGQWIRFAPLGGNKGILPGGEAVFMVSAPDLPGLVECKAQGGSSSIGVAAEPPGVLQNLFLAHDAWPHGYTIGPDERLAKMGLKGRLNYLVIRLPQMLELGWIENKKVMQWYKENLLAGKTAEVRARAESDFKRNLITSEVLALMTYLAR